MKNYATITAITTLLLAMPFSGVLAQQGEAEEIFDEEALGEIIELGNLSWSVPGMKSALFSNRPYRWT